MKAMLPRRQLQAIVETVEKSFLKSSFSSGRLFFKKLYGRSQNFHFGGVKSHDHIGFL
jgi:hypothetical protein